MAVSGNYDGLILVKSAPELIRLFIKAENSFGSALISDSMNLTFPTLAISTKISMYKTSTN